MGAGLLLVALVGCFDGNAQEILKRAASESGISERTVLVPVTVFDKDLKHVAGLRKENFTVEVDGKTQEIEQFVSGNEPLSICILFDTSASIFGSGKVGAQAIEYSNKVPSRIAKESHELNEYSLLTFNSAVEKKIVGASRDEFITTLENLPRLDPKGNTAIYDAIREGLEVLTKAKYSRRALIVLGDLSPDNASTTKLRELRERIGGNNILVYFINSVGPRPAYLAYSDFPRSEITELSRGGFKLYDPEFPGETYEESQHAFIGFIIDDMRYHYALGFKKPVTKSSWPRIKIKLSIPAEIQSKHKKVVARGRERYFAGP